MPRRILILALVLAASLAGQNITGTITGVVEDLTAGKIAGASVIARNIDTGISYKTTTTEAGVYVLPMLPLGNYEVTIESAGLKTFVRGGLALSADERLRVDATLAVGSISEKMTVSGEAPLVDSEKATIGASFTPAQFDVMPVGRDPLNMLALVPGMLPIGSGYATGNVNGAKEENTDFKVDGTAATTTANGRASSQPIYEMVEEVVVQTAAYSAEYSRGAAQLSVNTKAGTNQFHGVLFHYFRNNDLDANSFMNNFFGNSQPVLKYNLFGATVGGPVILPKIYDGHNRTFFTFGYEGTRQRGYGQSVSNVPSPALRDGNFTGQPVIYDPATTRANPAGGFQRQVFPQNRIPADRMDPVAVKMMGIAYPLPNQPGQANNYVYAGATAMSADAFNARLDHNFNDRNRVTVRYIDQSTETHSRPRFPGPAGEGNQNGHEFENDTNHNLSAEHTWVAKPNLIQTLRFGYFRNTIDGWGPGTREDWAGQVGLKNAGPEVFPLVNIAGLAPFGGALLQTRVPASNYDISDTLLHVRGRHTLKFGAEWRHMTDTTYQPNITSGSFNFTTQPTMDPATGRLGAALASYLLGTPSTSNVAVYPPEGFSAIWNYLGAFVQDDFRASKKLTLNIGVRWDLIEALHEGQDRMSNFNLRTLQLDYVNKNGYPSTIYDPNRRDFAPRVGLAWSPFGNNRLAIRAGYGLFFLPPNVLNYQRFTIGPWNRQFTYQTPDNGITYPLTLSQGFPALDANSPLVLGTSSGVAFIPRHYPDGYMQQWSFNVQKELPGRTLLDIGYLGTKGTHLQGSLQLNQVPTSLLGPGNSQLRRPYPTLGSVSAWANPWGNSTYHSLQVRTERRFAHGFTMQAAYTFSKSIGDTSQNNGAGLSFGVTNVQDNYNLRAEKSVSGFDVPHSLAWAFAYKLPFMRARRGVVGALLGGWNLSAISNLQSGRPLIMGTAQNLTGSLDGGSRPNRLASGQLSGSARGIRRWFDLSAFAQPAPFTFGNDSRTEPDLRDPAQFNLNTMLVKQFRVLEKRRVEFRAEANNVLNHFSPGSPNTNIGTPGAGTITTGNAGRSMQLALKFYY